MAFGKTLYLFAEVSGQLVNAANDPVPGVTIKRTWNAPGPGKSGEDDTVTDATGRFHLPEITARSFLAAIVPQSATVVQNIFALTPDGREVLLYGLDKNNYDQDGELNGSPYTGPGLNIRCSIDGNPQSGTWFVGTCAPF